LYTIATAKADYGEAIETGGRPSKDSECLGTPWQIFFAVEKRFVARYVGLFAARTIVP